MGTAIKRLSKAYLRSLPFGGYWILYQLYLRLYCLHNVRLGKSVVFEHRSYIYAGDGHITFGDNCSVNVGAVIDANFSSKVVIGGNVMIAPYVVIVASSHLYDRTDIPMHSQGHKAGQIVIKDDVWICSHAVILPDVTIGKGAVIGAGAVVDRDVEPFTVVGGIPARFIKRRG